MLLTLINPNLSIFRYCKCIVIKITIIRIYVFNLNYAKEDKK